MNVNTLENQMKQVQYASTDINQMGVSPESEDLYLAPLVCGTLGLDCRIRPLFLQVSRSFSFS